MGKNYNSSRLVNGLSVDASGNVGVGGSPSGSYKFEVTGTGRFTGALTGAGATFSGLLVSNTSDAYPEFRTSAADADVLLGFSNTGDGNNGWGIGRRNTGEFWIANYTGNFLGGTRTVPFQLASTGAATFSSTAQNAFLINSTNTDGPILQIQNSGNNLGLIGNAEGITNGGATNFAIRATNNLIFSTGGANPRMTITSGGNVGIGTSSPSDILDVQKNQNATTNFYLRNTDTTNTSSRAYLNVIAGNVLTSLQSINNDHSYLQCTNNIYFQTAGGTRAVITSSGNFGIGTSSPASILHILDSSANNTTLTLGTGGEVPTIKAGGTNTDLQIESVGGGGFINLVTNTSSRMLLTASGQVLIGKTTTSVETNGIRFDTNGVMYASIVNGESTYYVRDTSQLYYRFYVTGGGQIYATNTSISAISDQRLKENIQDLDTGLDAIMALRPRKYDWKAESGNAGKNVRGFIAQEVEQIFPDLIDEWKNDKEDENAITYKSLRQDFIPVLVKAIQEQQAQIQELNTKLQDQQQTINSLINR